MTRGRDFCISIYGTRCNSEPKYTLSKVHDSLTSNIDTCSHTPTVPGLEETALDDAPSEHSDAPSSNGSDTGGMGAPVYAEGPPRRLPPITTTEDSTPPDNAVTSPLSPRKLYGPMFSATEGLNSAIAKALTALEQVRNPTPSPVGGRSPGAPTSPNAYLSPPPAFGASTPRSPSEPLYDLPEGQSPDEHPAVDLPGAVPLEDGELGSAGFAAAPEVDFNEAHDFSFVDGTPDGARHAMV